MFDIVWFGEAQKDEAYRLVKRLSEAEIAKRELWACHGLRFKLKAPIPDEKGRLTEKVGISIQPNIYGSESLSSSQVENTELGRTLKLARFCKFEVLPSGIVGGTWINGLLGTPDFLKAAQQSQEDEVARFKAVGDLRAKMMAEKLESAAPFTLKWTRAVAILAALADPDSLNPTDAVELYDVLSLSTRGLPPLQDFLESKGISMRAEKPQLSEDPLLEAQDAIARFNAGAKNGAA